MTLARRAITVDVYASASECGHWWPDPDDFPRLVDDLMMPEDEYFETHPFLYLDDDEAVCLLGASTTVVARWNGVGWEEVWEPVWRRRELRALS